jgi:hypothetical protein
LRPFSFEENISSFDTVENLASAGAAPTVLLFSAKAGPASRASEVAINTIFFMLSSNAKSMPDNARLEEKFPQIQRSIYDAARCVSS